MAAGAMIKAAPEASLGVAKGGITRLEHLDTKQTSLVTSTASL